MRRPLKTILIALAITTTAVNVTVKAEPQKTSLKSQGKLTSDTLLQHSLLTFPKQ
ncbi:hypothetical protein ACP8HI_26240 [Paenibacillus sp. FA6]|uniref:hypothetical protein n=1 Tax=Paenibacillus sp. FA6 TaxID=3413029 RepID=UPI003F65965C